MKNYILFSLFTCLLFLFSCEPYNEKKSTAKDEANQTEVNQAGLNQVQPAPRITWSLERDNLIKRFKLQNDRSVMFYMYVFIEGVSQPVGYYQVNKVSSVNSQLTNTEQIIDSRIGPHVENGYVLPSPAEDGSYGTNGDAVFGFTPEEIYIEHNMKYIVSTVSLHFKEPVNKLALISVEDEDKLKLLMDRINK